MLEALVDSSLRGGFAYRELIGGFLLAHLEVERAMEALIARWFVDHTDAQTALLFQTALLQRMTFKVKLNVLRTLLEGAEETKPVLQRIDAANTLRNKLAHRRVVFLDSDQTTFRFEPDDRRGPMTIPTLRSQVRDALRLPDDLYKATIVAMANRSPIYRSVVQRAAARRAMELFLEESEAGGSQDIPE